MFLQWRVEEMVARLSWTKLSPINNLRNIEFLDTELMSRQNASSHFLKAIQRYGAGRGAQLANR